MTSDKKAFIGSAVAVGVAVIALISILSVSNGQVRQELKKVKSQSGGEHTDSSDQIEKLDHKIGRLEKQVRENVEIANENYRKYNRLVATVDTVVDDIKGTSKTRLLKAIDKIQSDDVRLDDTAPMKNEHSS